MSDTTTPATLAVEPALYQPWRDGKVILTAVLAAGLGVLMALTVLPGI